MYLYGFVFILPGSKTDTSNQIDDGNESDSGSIASSVSTALSDDERSEFQGGIQTFFPWLIIDP